MADDIKNTALVSLLVAIVAIFIYILVRFESGNTAWELSYF